MSTIISKPRDGELSYNMQTPKDYRFSTEKQRKTKIISKGKYF